MDDIAAIAYQGPSGFAEVTFLSASSNYTTTVGSTMVTPIQDATMNSHRFLLSRTSLDLLCESCVITRSSILIFDVFNFNCPHPPLTILAARTLLQARCCAQP
jgi:hypothetical protein